jgi:hypothetical protein
MNQMRLYASMMAPTVRDFELFAVLEAVSDEARRHDENTMRRDIEGTVVRRGPIWDDYLNFWRGAADPAVQQNIPSHLRNFTEGGRLYLKVNGLQVDCDHYGLYSALNVDGDTLRLILMERFAGTVEEYRGAVAARHQRVQVLIDRATSGQFTVNDYRELIRGLPRLPNGDQLLGDAGIKAMLADPKWREVTRNSV